MAAPIVQPWRTGRSGRPAVPLPPQAMPLRLGRRPLKRWRWVGCFADELMLCAAVAHVGPVPVAWWAVWDREARTLVERVAHRSSLVRLEGSRVRVDDGPVAIDLALAEGPGIETVSPHGPAGYAWTRKQGGVRATGMVHIGERRFAIDGRAIVDDSAGYHARRTSWRWCAGVGVAASGAAVAWNLVDGLHDAPEASERTVWVDGEPQEVGPVGFVPGLAGVGFGAGGALRFTPEVTRARRERLLLVASDYEQPFGTLHGELPVAGELRSGVGVMERHAARW